MVIQSIFTIPDFDIKLISALLQPLVQLPALLMLIVYQVLTISMKVLVVGRLLWLGMTDGMNHLLSILLGHLRMLARILMVSSFDIGMSRAISAMFRGGIGAREDMGTIGIIRSAIDFV